MSRYGNFVNEENGSSRIFTRDDLRDMDTNEYLSLEKAIYNQLRNIGIPTRQDLSLSSDVVLVHAYTKHDGTAVKEHYRSKPGQMSVTPTSQPDGTYQGGKKLPDEHNPEDEEEQKQKVTEALVLAVLSEMPDFMGSKELVFGLWTQMKEFNKNGTVLVPDSEKEMRKASEQAKLVIEKGFGFVEKLVEGDFENIDWFGVAKDLKLSSLLSMVHPVLGSIASFGLAAGEMAMKLAGKGFEGDNSIKIGDLLGVMQSVTGGISDLIGSVGSKLGDLGDMTEAEKAQAHNSYQELKDIQKSSYRFEKLVEAELYEPAKAEAQKLGELSQNFMSKTNFELTPKELGYDGVSDISEPKGTFIDKTIEKHIGGDFELPNFDDINLEDIKLVPSSEPLNGKSSFAPAPKDIKIAKAKEYQSLCSQGGSIVRSGDKFINQAVSNGYTVVDIQAHEDSNFKAVTYQKGDDIVVCFLGTEKTPKDWKANYDMWSQGTSKQMQDAEKYFDSMQDNFKDKNITVIGHSEGGSEALYVSVKNDVRAYTFNAYGLNKTHYQNGVDYTNQITNFRVSNDFVSKLRAPRGETFILPSKQGPLTQVTPYGAYKSHGIEKMGQGGKYSSFDDAVRLEEHQKRNPFYLNNLSRVAYMDEMLSAQIRREMQTGRISDSTVLAYQNYLESKYMG